MAAIDANIDDVQAGVEACARAANTLLEETSKLNGSLKGALLRSLTRQVKKLQACARDQRKALQELRNSVARLREDLKVARRPAIIPSRPAIADPKRQ
jgi:archaellum component FlaC